MYTRILLIIFSSLFSLGLLAGCGSTSATTAKNKPRPAIQSSVSNAATQYKLAADYLKQTPPNYHQAVILLQQAAGSNSAPAQFLLGNLYLQGRGVEPSISTAVALFEQAAQNNYVVAQYQLAQLHLEQIRANRGQAIEQAVALLQQAANSNYPPAQKLLADVLLANAKDTAQINLALQWYQRASELGHPAAAATLGYLFSTGNYNVPLDPQQAFSWAEIAAQAGYPQAQYFIGNAYLVGNGVTKDLIQAYAWLSLASANGIAAAQTELNAIADILPAQQTATAWKLSGQYAQTYNVGYNATIIDQAFTEQALRAYFNNH